MIPIHSYPYRQKRENSQFEEIQEFLYHCITQKVSPIELIPGSSALHAKLFLSFAKRAKLE